MKLKRLTSNWLFFLYFTTALGLVFLVNLQMRQEATEEASALAESILQRNMALHRYMDEALKPRIFAALEQDGTSAPFDPVWMSSTYAVREIDKMYRPFEAEGYFYKEAAVDARNPQNEADPFERDFLERLNADPELQSASGVRKLDGVPFFTVMHRGEVTEESCLRCHGEPADAPPGLIAHYGGIRAFHRQPGQVVSAISIRIPLAGTYGEANRFSLQLSSALVLALLALFLVQNRLNQRLLFSPLDRLREKFLLIASRREHLGEQVLEPAGEELAGLARAFNTLSAELRRERDHLEESVAARTAQLLETNEQLRTDIELRQSMEQALRTSRGILAGLIEASPLPIVSFDLDGKIHQWNGAAQAVFGWTADEAVGGPNPFVTPETEPEYRKLFGWIAAGEILAGREIVRHRKDGAAVRLHLYGSPLRNPAGEILGVMAIFEDITERKRAEEELRASEERLQILFESAPDPYYLHDLQGVFVQGNRAAEELIGCARGEMIGQNFLELDILVEEDLPKALENLAHNAAGHPTGPTEFTLKRRDGRRVPIEVRTYPVRMDGDTLVLGIARDISERKEAERALRESQRSFREMLSNVGMVSMILDKEARVVFCNEFLLEVTGRSREEVMGANWMELFIPPEISEELQSIFDEVIAAGPFPTRHENEILTSDGRRLLISWNNTVLRNAQGEITGTASIGEDITERRQMEARLWESRLQFQKLSQEFQTVLDGIPDSLSLISAEGRIVWANRGTLTLLGLGENPTGRTCRELWCRSETGCLGCPVARSFDGGRTESDRMQGPEGRTWGVKTFPVPEADGRVTQVIRWASDITEQIQVQEDAIRSSRLASLGELAAGVAHEINNPNGLILLNSALLRDVLTDAEPLLDEYLQNQGDFSLGGLGYTRLREELPHILGETLDAAQRIRRIVEDLKNFARQDGTDLTERVDINAAAQTALRLVRSVLGKATDAFTLELAGASPAVAGNAQRLEQVIVNLLMNACQALPDRSRGISLSTRRDDTGNRVVLEVRDEGTGIPAELLSKITNPFFTTRRETGGTGLGLAVSARIVKEHGGQLLFDSTPGLGTTVTMILPQLKENAPK